MSPYEMGNRIIGVAALIPTVAAVLHLGLLFGIATAAVTCYLFLWIIGFLGLTRWSPAISLFLGVTLGGLGVTTLLSIVWLMQ